MTKRHSLFFNSNFQNVAFRVTSTRYPVISRMSADLSRSGPRIEMRDPSSTTLERSAKAKKK